MNQQQNNLSSLLPTVNSTTPRPTFNLKLTKFNMAMIPDDAVVVMIGRRGTGKSWLIKDLMYHKRNFPVCTIMSGTEGANQFYSTIVPSLLVHNGFSSDIVTNVLKRQELLTKQIRKEAQLGRTSSIDRRNLVVMDDCMFDAKTWTKDTGVRSLFMNGRHYGILFILALQYVMGIPPALRGQVDYVFILRENIVASRRRIYEQFAGIFPSYELFSQILDQCTENFECLVIHNGAKTNKIEDCVFYYKAESNGDFKIGSKELWIKSAEYDRQKELAEAAGETAPQMTTTGVGVQKGPIVQVKKY